MLTHSLAVLSLTIEPTHSMRHTTRLLLVLVCVLARLFWGVLHYLISSCHARTCTVKSTGGDSHCSICQPLTWLATYFSRSVAAAVDACSAALPTQPHCCPVTPFVHPECTSQSALQLLDNAGSAWLDMGFDFADISSNNSADGRCPCSSVVS